MDLVTIEIMRELAAMKGKRNVDGTWNSSSVGTLESYLVRAIALQQRAQEKAENLAKTKSAESEDEG